MVFACVRGRVSSESECMRTRRPAQDDERAADFGRIQVAACPVALGRAAVREGNDRVAGGGVVPASCGCAVWSPRREESDSVGPRASERQREKAE